MCGRDALSTLERSEFGRFSDGGLTRSFGTHFLEQSCAIDQNAHLPIHHLPLSLHAGFEDVPLSLRCLAHLDELLRRVCDTVDLHGREEVDGRPAHLAPLELGVLSLESADLRKELEAALIAAPIAEDRDLGRAGREGKRGPGVDREVVALTEHPVAFDALGSLPARVARNPRLARGVRRRHGEVGADVRCSLIAAESARERAVRRAPPRCYRARPVLATDARQRGPAGCLDAGLKATDGLAAGCRAGEDHVEDAPTARASPGDELPVQREVGDLPERAADRPRRWLGLGLVGLGRRGPRRAFSARGSGG